ncbi:glycosyltransferase [Shewanella psychrophila]|uniref:Glycosyltransferase n=1 Tax=Shewanella psychrophila TaxID=225848 RepID=A0A1S6HT73_9GAMM|nr:glycosyltransferase family 4 protein [Shewanella psychrophila]AQS38746.1 glycosyltransferase [Shewanella psychrophila]
MRNRERYPIAQVMRRFHLKEWGGMEAAVWNTSQGLKLHHHINSHILCTQALNRVPAELLENIPIERFRYHYPYLGLTKEKKLKLDKKGGNPYSFSLSQRLLTGEFRLYHCHTMQRMAAMVRYAARRRGLPYIISLHGGQFTVPQTEIDSLIKPLEKTLNAGKAIDLLLQAHKVLSDASGIICIGYNEYLKTRIQFPQKPVIYLPNGVNSNHFSTPSSLNVHQHLGIPKERNLLLSIGRIDSQKNQLMLVDLLNRLHDKGENQYQLILAGPVIQSSYLSQILSRIKHYRLQAYVTIIPGIEPDHELLPALYQQSSCFLLASTHEPFGIVVLEAWSAGLPIVASRVGSLVHLIRHNQDGLLFNPDNLDSLQANISKILTSPSFAKKLSKRGLARVASEYCWPQVVSRLQAFYQTVENWHYSQ